LPRQLPEGRLYSGMRRQGQREDMANAIENLNANMEAFFRLQSQLTKQLGADKDHLNPEIVKALQNILNDIRYSSENREISLSLRQFIAECYAYPFFKGQLKSSWAFAEKIVALAKLTPEQKAAKRLSDIEKDYLNKPEVVEMAKEFRGFFANIGPIPRAILETMDLSPINVSDVAQAANTFVHHHGKAPSVDEFGANYLNTLLDHSISISPQGVWRNLSTEAKSFLAARFDSKSRQDFETTINDFFVQTKQIPEFDLELALGHERDVYTNLTNRLALEMNRKLLAGEVNISALSPEVRMDLEQSEVLADMVVKLREVLAQIKNEAPTSEYIKRLKQEGYFKYEYLMLTKELGLLKTLKDLADLNPRGAAAKYVEQLLADLK